MKFNETFVYPGNVEESFAIIADEAFRANAAESGGAKDVKATVETSGSDTVITIVRTQPAEIPDFAKSLVGDTVTVKQVETWGAPESDGSRHATVRMKVAGQPAEFTGKAELTPAAKGSDFVVHGDVVVSVPFIGKKLEPVVAKAIGASLTHDVHAGIKKFNG